MSPAVDDVVTEVLSLEEDELDFVLLEVPGPEAELEVAVDSVLVDEAVERVRVELETV